MWYTFKFYLYDDNPTDFAKSIINFIRTWEDKNCCFIYHFILDKTILYVHLEWKKYNRQFKNFLQELDSNAVKPYCFDVKIFKELNIKF